jgi:pimeloyl-ACP methyl ester carboxylesterase
LRPWGFDLGAIGVPVLLTYGLADAFVPPQHGRWLAAHLPTAQVEVSPEGGHLIADPDAEIGHALSWLRDPAVLAGRGVISTIVRVIPGGLLGFGGR